MTDSTSRRSSSGMPVVGMIGGGQLARMTHQAAIALGQTLRVLVTDPADSAAVVTPDVELGSHTDLAALRSFAKSCDVITFDHEHVPGEHIRALADEGVAIFPGADALLYAQDKAAMRERLGELGAPIPRWQRLTSAAELASFGLPAVVKTTRGGYDGRGVFVIRSLDELFPGAALPAAEPRAAIQLPDVPLIAEELVPLRRELAVQVARSPYGQVAAYPVVETVQRDGICVEVLAPAPNLPKATAVAAQQLAIRLATELDVVGLLAVELFETPDGLVVNELAMRPHNSGHWTIEGSRTSQFEQHLRAVLDYPLGDTRLTAPAVVMANVLGGPASATMGMDERLHHLMAAEPAVKVHLYGKQTRPGRKIGHVTALGDDLTDCRARAARAAHWLQFGESR